jgi:hypothetical protein
MESKVQAFRNARAWEDFYYTVMGKPLHEGDKP